MMNGSPTPSRRIAIVGGGISGLAAAHRLVELGAAGRLKLFEAGPRLGGVLSTVEQDGFQVEQSADNFITTIPWGIDLCKRLGLADNLVQTNPACRRTFVVRSGRLYKLPDGFLMMAPTRLWPLAVTPILSPWGKLRAAMEYFIPPRSDDGDESMAAFVRRRLGCEAFERLVEPLVSAVYAADMEKLSLLATLPRFREMEVKYGSLIRAMRAQMRARPAASGESGARYSMFVTLRDGLSRLVETLAARLPEGVVRLNTPVARIDRVGGVWRVWFHAPAATRRPMPGAPQSGTVAEGEGEILPGISCRVVHGHTTALQCPVISDGTSTLLFCADLLPTSVHVPLPWIMAYDLRPLVTLEEKRRILTEAADGGWTLFFEHDPVLAAARLARNDRGGIVLGERVEGAADHG